MLSTGINSWADLDGYAVAHGMDFLQDMPIDRFVNFVWYMLVRNREPDDVTKLRNELWQQPKGEVVTDTRSPWNPKNEGDALSALKASMGGGTGRLATES